MLEISNYMSFATGEPEMDCKPVLDAGGRGGGATQAGIRQAERLEGLIRAAAAARGAAGRGLLFASHSGHALVNAAFDLFECDGLYALGEDVAHELGLERDG